MTDEPTPEPSSAPQRTPLSNNAKTGLFVAGLALVVGTFWALSSMEAPPDMPPDGMHLLRFNSSGMLLGFGEGAQPTEDADGSPLKMDKKSVAKRVNIGCTACHGSPELDLTSHACRTTPGPCLPPAHPRKATCIKCHRMPPLEVRRKAGAPGAVAPVTPAPSAPAPASPPPAEAPAATGDGGAAAAVPPDAAPGAVAPVADPAAPPATP